MKSRFILPFLLIAIGAQPLAIAMGAQPVTPVIVLKTSMQGPQPSDSEIIKTVRAHINTEEYREVRVQLIRDSEGKPSHYLVYLHSKTSHRVDFAKISIDKNFKVLSVQQNYQLQEMDLKQQPGATGEEPTSPSGQQ